MERCFSNVCLRCFTLLTRPGCIHSRFSASSEWCLTSISRSRFVGLQTRPIKTRSAAFTKFQRPTKLLQCNFTKNNIYPLMFKEPLNRNVSGGRGGVASGNKANGQFPIWIRVLVVAGVGGALYLLLRDAERKKEIDSEKTRYVEFSKAKLGGDWSLIDHHGNRRSSADFHGEWVLIYFGFTHCPDICPEELEKLALVVKTFDERQDLPNIQPIFITLDPERDTPAAIKDYCAEFKSPRLLGFTGTEEEIRKLAKKYRVYFGKGERDENNDYIVDHTIIIYLVNPRGEFVNYFGRNMDAEQISKSITRHIEKYNELETKNLR